MIIGSKYSRLKGGESKQRLTRPLNTIHRLQFRGDWRSSVWRCLWAQPETPLLVICIAGLVNVSPTLTTVNHHETAIWGWCNLVSYCYYYCYTTTTVTIIIIINFVVVVSAINNQIFWYIITHKQDQEI